MGIGPPGGVLLHGPPGSGKSFAARRLAEFLGWPVFEINAGTVGSPYIHHTSMRLRELFESAANEAPSIVLIDEVDALLRDRDASASDHAAEEVGEFLTLVERSAERCVLVIATTNRRYAIDAAVVRHGRFDHVVEVALPSANEAQAVLESVLDRRPHVGGMNLEVAAEKLSGRPLSDIEWAVNEAARAAVRAGKKKIDDVCLFRGIAGLEGR